MEITMKEKDAISESLRAYVAKYPSQTKAAGSLKGVSVGTVSNILNGRYELFRQAYYHFLLPINHLHRYTLISVNPEPQKHPSAVPT